MVRGGKYCQPLLTKEGFGEVIVFPSLLRRITSAPLLGKEGLGEVLINPLHRVRM